LKHSKEQYALVSGVLTEEYQTCLSTMLFCMLGAATWREGSPSRRRIGSHHRTRQNIGPSFAGTGQGWKRCLAKTGISSDLILGRARKLSEDEEENGLSDGERGSQARAELCRDEDTVELGGRKEVTPARQETTEPDLGIPNVYWWMVWWWTELSCRGTEEDSKASQMVGVSHQSEDR